MWCSGSATVGIAGKVQTSNPCLLDESMTSFSLFVQIHQEIVEGGVTCFFNKKNCTSQGGIY